MLPPEHRLRSTRDFQHVYRRGRSWAHPLAVLHVTPRPGDTRIGFSVSRKVGKAVRRNRARRRLREIVRQRLRDGAWRAGFHAVFVARPGVDEAEFAALEGAVDELARRARLTRAPDEEPGAPYTLPPTGRRRERGARPQDL